MDKTIAWQTMDFARQKRSSPILPATAKVKRASRKINNILSQVPIFELLTVVMIVVFAIFVVSLLRDFETSPQEIARLQYLA